MKQVLGSTIVSLVLVAGFFLLALPAKASICAGPPYAVSSSGIGPSYSAAYDDLVDKLGILANNYNGRCQAYGTCNETVTVTGSEQIPGIGFWIVRGDQDFQCNVEL